VVGTELGDFVGADVGAVLGAGLTVGAELGSGLEVGPELGSAVGG